MDTIVYAPKSPTSEAVKQFVKSVEDDPVMFTLKAPQDKGLSSPLKVHCPEYVHFIHKLAKEGVPSETCVTYPHARLLRQTSNYERYFGSGDGINNPSDTSGRLGYYFFDTSFKGVDKDTYAKSLEATQIASSCAAAITRVEQTLVIGVVEVPGHQAAYNLTGGGSVFNHVAVCAQELLEISDTKSDGRTDVGILHLGFEHHSGTQSLFYTRQNPIVVSVHGRNAFPYHTGTPQETGWSSGHTYNENLVVDPYATIGTFQSALKQALTKLKDVDYLIVSLNTTILSDLPKGKFALTKDDMYVVGSKIAELVNEGTDTVIFLNNDEHDLEVTADAWMQFLSPFGMLY